jgi:murein DD-endopeptidase MepM/ murein hydrolase activator NlpD
MRSQNERKPSRVLAVACWSSLALAGLLSGFAAWQMGEQPGTVASATLVPLPHGVGPETPAAAAEAVSAPVLAAAAQAPIQVRIYSEGEIARNETLASALDRHGISAQLVNEIASALRPVFDFRYARAGDQYRLAQDEHGRIAEFDYRRSATERYTLRRVGEELVAARVEPEILVKQARVAGVISTSLYDAIDALGESGELAHDFSQIFAWDIDFSRAVRPGDEFHILYERRYLRDDLGRERYVGAGRILAARSARVSGKEHSAVYYAQDTGRGGYYREDGSAVERQFLAAPLNYRRISSNYSNARVHPITGLRRPHLGIDYAAASGTPVWAVAAGRVSFRGWLGGLGKTVKVRHDNGYESWYGHLSRFPNLRLGQRVQQKQVIGYVGSTGLSTGPHLHFTLQKNGRLVNPLTVRTAAATPIPPQLMHQFAATRDGLLQALDPKAMRVVTNEAL